MLTDSTEMTVNLRDELAFINNNECNCLPQQQALSFEFMVHGAGRIT